MIPKAVLMIRPKHFGYNPETATSNAFQRNKSMNNAAAMALAEFDNMVATLNKSGIETLVFEDRDQPICPDAVFPNNWLAIMPNGPMVLFPMTAKNRRLEVNLEVVLQLKAMRQNSDLIDLTPKAEEDCFLEGTGSIVFDHINRLAYACESPRTNLQLLSDLCRQIAYTPISFRATDMQGRDIYHTNVLMSVGKNRIVICLDAIEDSLEKSMIKQRFQASGKAILDISHRQMAAFAGNVLEVKAGNNNCWVLSSSAWESLNTNQRAQLESDGGVCVVHIPTIETLGGGSARCMMAGVY